MSSNCWWMIGLKLNAIWWHLKLTLRRNLPIPTSSLDLHIPTGDETAPLDGEEAPSGARIHRAMPPSITLEMAKGFTLQTVKVIMPGPGDGR
jgi:hypothetical protein